MPVQQLSFAEISDTRSFRVDVTYHRAVLADTVGAEQVDAMTDRQVLAATLGQRNRIAFSVESHR